MKVTFHGKWEGSEATIECKHDLIKALLIFYKYDSNFNTHCEHDRFHVAVRPHSISDEDTDELAKLSFHPDDWEGFSSGRYGSC